MPGEATRSRQSATDIDILGYRRGAHQDGAGVCEHFAFTVPGKPGLIGWNDVSGVYCARCGRRDIEHTVLADTAEKPPMRSNDASGPPLPGLHTIGAVAGPQARVDNIRTRESDRAINAQIGMLDSSLDPLAIAAAAHRSNSPRSPSPAEAPPPAEDAEAFKAEVERMVQRSIVDDARRQQTNEGFKAEVDRMVQTSVAPDRLERLAAPLPPGVHATASDLLHALQLSQYTAAFEAESLELPVLVSLARSGGKEALDEALREVGVTSVGHRLKIFSALH